jgi:D-alanyl-D-alanine carboxypeptidase (penicillin-binding protein 5/6)
VATRRPPLFSLQAGRRRHRRPTGLVVLLAATLVAVLLVAIGVGVALWRLLPLLDRGAGAIPPSALTGVAPVSGGHGAGGLAPMSATGASRKPIPGVAAPAAIVVDADSGRVLWARHAHIRRPVASLTKLMTVLLAERPGRLSRRFTITAAMTGEQGYTLGLRAGQRVTVRDMLAATLIASANDAADALAVRRSGSLTAFVSLMNHEAHRLRLSDTHFSNPSGIIDTGNASSAWDMADLARRLLKRPALRRLVAVKVYRRSDGGTFVSRNQLLWTYPDAIGVKTGSTTLAGDCLAAAARRNGHTVIAVVLDAHGDEFGEATKLLDLGFRRLPR